MKTSAWLGVLLCVGHVAHAQSSAANSVAVSAKGADYTIRVDRTEQLSVVLEKFCQASKTQCEGTEYASGAVVPLTVRGTWGQVVAKLLEGTGANYSAIPPDSRSAGRLVIRQGTAGNNRAGPLKYESLQPQQILESNPEGLPPLPAEETRSADTAIASPLSADGGVVSAPVAGGSSVFSAAQSSSGYDAMGVPITPSGAMIEPFPDKDGRPIPLVTRDSIAIEPFPDQHGQPIPLKKNGTAIEPFPDQLGRPIPLNSSK